MKFGYIIGPFRAGTPWEVEQNVRNAEFLGFEIAKLGAFPVIPHANSRFSNGQFTDAFWLEGTRALMERAADFAILVEAIGGDSSCSAGSIAEVRRMKGLGRPVFNTLDALKLWLTVSR